MRRIVRVLSLAAVLFPGLTPMPHLRAQVLPQKEGQIRYEVIDLGTLGGTFGYAGGLNNLGSVVGGATLSGDTAQHAFLWRNGRMTDLGTFGGPDSDAGFPPNDFNQVAGAAETATPDPLGEDFCGFGTGLTCLPFLWQKGKLTSLPLLGGDNGVAREINNWGVIAGASENTTQDPDCRPPQKLQSQPVYWYKGKVYPLPILPGDTVGDAAVINDLGQIAGRSGVCSHPGLHAVFWQNGRVIDMGNLGGTRGNSALDINSLGQVVGDSNLAGDETSHAFLWDKHSGMKDLGTLPGDFLSVADGINDFGQVVGGSCDSDFNCRAFLWQNGVMTDLNTLIPPDSSLYLVEATGTINNAGEIAGFAVDINSGEGHPFLLVPCGRGNNVAECHDYPQSAAAATVQAPRIAIPGSIQQMLGRYGKEKRVFPEFTAPLR